MYLVIKTTVDPKAMTVDVEFTRLRNGTRCSMYKNITLASQARIMQVLGRYRAALHSEANTFQTIIAEAGIKKCAHHASHKPMKRGLLKR